MRYDIGSIMKASALVVSVIHSRIMDVRLWGGGVLGCTVLVLGYTGGYRYAVVMGWVQVCYWYLALW